MLTSAKERSTRRGELLFIFVSLVFWSGVVAFLWPALANSFERQETASGFWVFATLCAFGVFMIGVSTWLLLLAFAEAEALNRADSSVEVSYLHLGKRTLATAPVRIRKIPVRLFRFNLEKGFEPAWLLLLGHWRLAVLSRQKFVE
jgi:hypothetical protein